MAPASFMPSMTASGTTSWNAVESIAEFCRFTAWLCEAGRSSTPSATTGTRASITCATASSTASSALSIAYSFSPRARGSSPASASMALYWLRGIAVTLTLRHRP